MEMNKPLSLAVEDTQKQVLEVLNEAKLPLFCWKVILTKVFDIVDLQDKEEVNRYIKEHEATKKTAEDTKQK